MSEYKMSHTGAELDEAIRRFNDGYILPKGDSPIITTNGSHPVRQHENAVVNVSNLTKYKTGEFPLSPNFVTGIYTSYEGNPLIIDIEDFSPKIFIFRPKDYDTGKKLTKYSTTYHIITSSVNLFSGLVGDTTNGNGMGYSFTSFITKTTASGSSVSGAEVTLSVGGTGFRKKDVNSTELYWFCNQTGYTVRNGTWFWEAYG